jgi:hypothetical protein
VHANDFEQVIGVLEPSLLRRRQQCPRVSDWKENSLSHFQAIGLPRPEGNRSRAVKRNASG